MKPFIQYTVFITISHSCCCTFVIERKQRMEGVGWKSSRMKKNKATIVSCVSFSPDLSSSGKPILICIPQETLVFVHKNQFTTSKENNNNNVKSQSCYLSCLILP